MTNLSIIVSNLITKARLVVILTSWIAVPPSMETTEGLELIDHQTKQSSDCLCFSAPPPWKERNMNLSS